MRHIGTACGSCLWGLLLASLLGAACGEDEGGPGGACATGNERLRACGLLSDGTPRCTVGPDEREEASCTQSCLAGAECATLSSILCSGQTPSNQDAANLSECISRCAEQFGFPCTGPYGNAVPTSFVCDGEADCLDASDEAGCEQFDCGDGQSVVAAWFCDGLPDCSDGSDEGAGCEHFSCASGTLVPLSFQCDGVDDCGDNSDEAGCDTALLQCP